MREITLEEIIAENIPKWIGNNIQIQDFCTLCRKIRKPPPDNVVQMKVT